MSAEKKSHFSAEALAQNLSKINVNRKNHNSPFSEVTNCRSFSKEQASPLSKQISKNLEKNFNCDAPVCVNISKESSKTNSKNLNCDAPVSVNLSKDSSKTNSKNLEKNLNCDTPVCVNLSKESSKANTKNNNSISNSKKLAVTPVRKSLPSNQLSQKVLANEYSSSADIIEKLNLNSSKSKTKVNYPIFVTEKKKRFPSSMKSVSEYLYECCLIYNMENIQDNIDKSTILNLDGRIFDMMESHYPMGQIFYLQESLKIMDSTLYKKKEGKFDLFDIYVQFDKTFNFYLKYGQKNNMVDDFNYHFNCFNKYLRTACLNLDIEKIKNNEREMDIAQEFWKKIVYLNENEFATCKLQVTI